MSKKILSVALALIFVLSTFAVSAFAIGEVGYEEDATLYTQTWDLEAIGNEDGTSWTVNVKLTTNSADYAVGAMQFKINNSNPDAAKLTDAVAGAAVEASEGFNADVQINKDTGVVAIIPQPTESALGLDLSEGGIVAVLTYSLTSGASATLSIDAATAKTATNPGGDLIAVRMSDGALASGTMICGQSVTADEDGIAAKAILGSAAATPVLNGVDTGVVDTANKYVYGVPAGADANDYFEVENGSFEITGTFTGAVLTVKDTAGTAVDTYTLIIFGDVNGDGAVTATDFAAVKDAATGGSIDGEANAFAADVNGDGSVTATDFAAVKDAATGGSITVNPYAA